MKILKHLFCFIFLVSALPGATVVELEPDDHVAIMSGQGFETWGWGASGYIRLLVDELERQGVRRPVKVCLEGKKTEQMLTAVDKEVIAKAPACVLLIPGTRDYNVFAQKTVDASFTDNLSAVIEKLQSASIPLILVTSHAKNSEPGVPRNAHADEHNDAIRELAPAYGVPLIDFVAVVNAAEEITPLDGSIAARMLINQMFAAEVLRVLGTSDEEILQVRQEWLDLPVVKLPPSVSVNTYEKIKLAAKASGQDPGEYITELIRDRLEQD